jgi:hypothetical protein
MTIEHISIEQANAEALAAARAGDLVALEKALRARREAIEDLARQPASAQLAQRMRQAVEGGRAIQNELFLFKQRTGMESARLARIAGGLALGCGVERQIIF